MKILTSCSLALALAAVVPAASAADLESGLQPGKFVGPFQVVKCAGPEDGVAVGDQLCYR
jgi:hypothetical protein